MSKISFIILISASLFSSCTAQPPVWSRTNNWKIYSVVGQKTFSLTVDSLQFVKSLDLDIDSVIFYIGKATPVPKEKTPVWMGNYLASCQDDKGKVRKIEISEYAGFFYDEVSESYFIVPRQLKNDWLNFVSNSLTSLKNR